MTFLEHGIIYLYVFGLFKGDVIVICYSVMLWLSALIISTLFLRNHVFFLNITHEPQLPLPWRRIQSEV